VDKGMQLARYFMVCIDVYSRYCKALAMKDRKVLSSTFHSLLMRMGIPRQITVDEEFGNNTGVRNTVNHYGIEMVVVSPWEKN
jgi:hypothetical protein